MSPFTIFVLGIHALLSQVHYGAARRYTLLNTPTTVAVYRPKLPSYTYVASQQCGCGCLSSSYIAPIGTGYSSGSGICSSSSSVYSGEVTGEVSVAGDIQACSVGSSSSNSCGDYGGEGTGEVNAAGDIQACGTTCVDGAVPVMGSVSFGGCAPACGSVSIYGQCGCGCN